jgi:2-polyprenyl-3-methyl-5-hydroxy-6-metoxy-1,4-benzoquinol methylase
VIELLSITKERSNELELMDDLSIQGEELELTLAEIEQINRAFGGYGPSIEGLASLVPPEAKRISVLDVGTGSADLPRRMVEWGRSRGIEVRVHAIDLAETTVARARRLSHRHPEIDVALENLFDIPDQTRFDVVHAALVLHHFPGASAVDAIRKMFQLSQLGVVVNDLHRHFVAWASIKVVTQLLAKSRLVRNDGPLSVRRGFTREDLFALCSEAGVPSPEVAWRPMFRWRMLIRRTGSTTAIA